MVDDAFGHTLQLVYKAMAIIKSNASVPMTTYTHPGDHLYYLQLLLSCIAL